MSPMTLGSSTQTLAFGTYSPRRLDYWSNLQNHSSRDVCHRRAGVTFLPHPVKMIFRTSHVRYFHSLSLVFSY